MVAGKVKAAMGFQKSPARPKPETPKHNCSSSQKTPSNTVFSRSFGVYFPRSSQVQPRPPDVMELVRLVEELQEKESRLRTELLQYKILKESITIVPVLEKEISSKKAEVEVSLQKIVALEAENEMLRREVECLKEELEKEETEKDKKIIELENEISKLRRTIDERGRTDLKSETGENNECSSSQRFQGLLIDTSSKGNQPKHLIKCGKWSDISTNQENQKQEATDLKADDTEAERINQSSCMEVSESVLLPSKVRAPRVPKPPPKRSSSAPSSSSSSPEASVVTRSRTSFENMNIPPLPAIPPPPSALGKGMPPPPPPPPLSRVSRCATAKVRRVPEVVEFYHSLMRRDSKRDSSAGVSDVPTAANAKNMIGEIENRSAYLLAIKSDVETQGDFIRFLINEVQSAAFTDIEDVVAFVKWLDDELSFLVDERAVLKHFEWPEHKADAMREAAFGYCDLKKLESEASSFTDDPRQPCGPSLKKMRALLEKLEHGLYNLSRMRDSATKRYKEFQIPSDWMHEIGFVSQIKLASVKLAMKYMKRVSAELEAVGGGPEEEELMLQGVRFAFRVHQFAGGFDMETMRAFEELRNKAGSCYMKCQSQPQKLYCRSTSC